MVDGQKAVAPPKIEGALLDPRWEFGTVRLGSFVLPTITLIYPGNMRVVSIVPVETLDVLISGLQKLRSKLP